MDQGHAHWRRLWMDLSAQYSDSALPAGIGVLHVTKH